MRKLNLKKSETHWVELKDGEEVVAKFLIDYPTLEQQDELDEIYTASMRPAIIKSKELIGNHKTDDPKDPFVLECQEKATPFIDSVKFRQYKRMLLKFCIKDWEGIDEPCVLIEDKKGTELEDGLWRRLVKDREQLDAIYLVVSPDVDFTNDDKKK